MYLLLCYFIDMKILPSNLASNNVGFFGFFCNNIWQEISFRLVIYVYIYQTFGYCFKIVIFQNFKFQKLLEWVFSHDNIFTIEKKQTSGVYFIKFYALYYFQNLILKK